MTAAPKSPVRKPGTTAAAPQPGARDDRSDRPGGAASRARDYLLQHPVAVVVVATGIGILLQSALTLTAPRGGQTGKNRKRGVSRAGSAVATRPAGGHRYDTGAAAMEFSSRYADGKNISFKFSWKKRPVELSDADWPVDQMGFTASRPDGKRTSFQFTRKTRRVPAGYGVSAAENYRPGLGEAKMEFSSSHAGGRDFRFTWTKQPPANAGKSSSARGGAADSAAVPAGRGRGKKGSGTRSSR